jgi:SsrA-binding protein
MKIMLKNKKVFFNYEILEREIAGMILEGTEVKSIKEGRVSFTDSYCMFVNNELWVKNLYISEYENGSYNNHLPKRDRKLLLTKNQIKKFQKKNEEKGLTIVPLSIFSTDKGLLKMEIGLAKGKKLYDKKAKIKEQDIDRETKLYVKIKNSL